MGGLFYSLFVSCDFKFVFYINVCAIFTYFLEKITLNELFLWDSQFWEMADFFQIVIRDIAMTCTNIVLGQTLFKLLKLLGPTHKNKRVHDLIVWPCGFLKYAHKLQGGLHLATQYALNVQFYYLCYICTKIRTHYEFSKEQPDYDLIIRKVWNFYHF
jgi:hypothetical protein